MAWMLLLAILAALWPWPPLSLPPVRADGPAFDTVYGFGDADMTMGVVLGDLNGDGTLDVVVGNNGQQNLVYFNDGSGILSTGIPLGGAGNTNDVAVGDVNGDGALDIVVGNYDEQSLVYLNDGEGAFSSGIPFGGADPTMSVAVGDLNGDGALDIVVGNMGQQSLVYLNNGSGSFSTGTSFGGADDTTSVAVGDLNGDGALDIVVGNRDQQSLVYLNNGSGSFLTGTPFGNADYTTSVVVGDLNGDEALDIVAGNSGIMGGQQNVVYLNDGPGTFSSANPFGGADWTNSVALGDLNGDGTLDLVVANTSPYGGGGKRVYLNDGSGILSSSSSFGGSEWTYSVVLGDLNGDGALDVVAGNSNTSGSQNLVYLNGGTATFSPASSLPESWYWTQSVAVGDLDSDGDLDIVVGNDTDPDLIYLNDGTGAFSSGRSFGSSNTTYSVAVGDLNGDEALDIVLGNHGQQSLIYLNNGSGAFSSGSPFGGADETRSVALGDLNGDGALDIVVGNAGQQSLVYLNNGSGAFSSAIPFGEADSTYSMALGDLNGDGALDIVAGNWTQPNRVYLNDGAGSFPTGIPFGGPDRTMSVAVGDLDGDGLLDIVVGNGGVYGAQQNLVYLNDGTGNFPLGTPFGGADDTVSVAVGDVTGDGALDIVVGNGFAEPIYLYLNDGTGGLANSHSLDDVGIANGLAMGDLNGDGSLDLVVGNRSLSGAPTQVYLNRSHLPARLTNNMPYLRVTRPCPTANAGLYSTPEILLDASIPLTYTLFDPEGDPVRTIRAFYSPDGGGRWLPAVAKSGTVTTDLTLGSALAFDGVDDWVETADFDINNDFTLSLWVNPAITTTSQAFIGKHDAGGNNLVLFGYYLSSYYVNIRGSIFYSVTATTGWQHLAVVGKQSGTTTAVTVYRNGEILWQRNIAQVLGNVSGGRAWTIGQDWDPPSTQSDFFKGQMDEVRIWNVARTQAEIQADRYLRLQGDEPNLVAYWPFDEGTGSTVFDQTRNGYDGVLGGGVTIRRPRWIGGPFAIYVYRWDVFASGFFGQSDNVVFRVQAYPTLGPTVNGVPGPYQYAYASATTFPFRVRGTQVRVLSDTVPAANALVYRLPADQTTGGALISDSAGRPFHTDPNGYLQGRGELVLGDQLLAMAPITWTDSYTLYYTSGTPTALGMDADTVTVPGVQTLTVSADNPLYLFNLDLTLEWDASHDPAYLDELTFNLQRASEYLYDFTNGQAALGRVRVFQNADDWAYTHIVVRASNRQRPFAAQGGIVLTDTVDLDHADIVYAPGQVVMGSTWNRYGRPGASIGDDWALILAHELSHYLLYHDDVYLGLDENGYLVAVDTCAGSAMGDLYNDPNASEFIYDDANWQAHCANTLAAQTLERNEWETMRLWYPDLRTPPPGNAGPSLMPFGLTSVAVYDPLTPTLALADPTFYLLYQDGQTSSSSARAYLLRDNAYVLDLGSPFGGQNRVLARGARPAGSAGSGDRLCVFDPAVHQFGCEAIESGDEQMVLRHDDAWAPVIQVTPVTSTTFGLRVQFAQTLPGVSSLRARLYPEFGVGTAPAVLARYGTVYSGTIHLDDPTMYGHVQVWVEEPSGEDTPRREAIVAFSIGGHPATLRPGGAPQRAGGATLRPGGATLRPGGATLRPGGATLRPGGAPASSPDGQMILYTPDAVQFEEGQFYAIQTMAGLPSLPPGRTVIGLGYRLVATPGTPMDVGSVSIQYLQNDLLSASANERGLSIYFYNGVQWRELPTVRDAYYDLVSAPSQGAGIYALLSSVQIPLYEPGWNLIGYPLSSAQPVTDALASVSGQYATVYGYDVRDSADPWEVYSPGKPAYVNDLTVLEPGRGYWISATQAVTIHLSPQSSVGASGIPPSPPDTYYGPLNGGEAFVPFAGMAIEARIGGRVCGRGRVSAYGGQWVYVIDVEADDPRGAYAGCGQVGRTVTLYADGHEMSPPVSWDNAQLNQVALSFAPWRIYLPMVFKKR